MLWGHEPLSFLASTGPVWIRDPSGTESRNMQLNKINRCSDSWLGRLPLTTNWKMPVLHGPPAKVKVVHLLRCHTHTHTRLYTKKLLLTDTPTASTQGSFYGEDFFTGKLLQTKALYTQKLLLREACKQSSFTHRSFYTHTKKRTAFSQSSFYTLKPLLVRTHKPLRKGTLHTRGGTLHKRFYTQQLSHRSL